MFHDRIRDVSKRTVRTYSRTEDENEIQNKLNEWEVAGYIKILKPIEECENLEPCIRLITRISIP